MKKQFFLIAAVLTISIANAQQVSEIKLKTKGFNLKKAKKQDKVYINSFNVFFEVYKEIRNKKAGYKGTRGKVVGDAKVSLGVGLKGVDIAAIQQKTDLLYQETINKIKASGYQLVPVNEAKNLEIFEGYEVLQGPLLLEKEELPGVIQTVPAGYSFLSKIPKKTDVGKSLAKFTKKFKHPKLSRYPKISKELGDVMVLDINMYVMFTEAPKPGFNLGSLDKVAKVKINTNYRLVDRYTVVNSGEDKKSLLGIKSAGNNIATDVLTEFSVVYGRNKIGGSALATYDGNLKKPIEINGVLKKEKIKAYQSQQTIAPTLNNPAYQKIGGITLATIENRFSKNASWIQVDGAKHSDGLYNACHLFLEQNLKEVFD
ncbi:hypothetical protein [Ochrovirga pacifica]|uniref:hypothetical protein n=1 Tax=Ochrovirga pacifica TaxID=1042376 RepID=UPI000255A2A6|nr:hypothetical protein [Ochrovirga pacifica]